MWPLATGAHLSGLPQKRAAPTDVVNVTRQSYIKEVRAEVVAAMAQLELELVETQQEQRIAQVALHQMN